ncbi:MAG: hypothetical protein A2521_05370 [Deltaproteobacteria bacterium RIFOXYD12_FULL_57_12]|nr:MAG: hypothetical protein A2521_05370 [Deltaproteobacteria bacterium RIFOXYD12_FULL_57_12]
MPGRDDTWLSSRSKVCPESQGRKLVPGTCECNMEWRGTEVNGEWVDCRCARETACSRCQGTGFVAPD